MTIAKTNSKTPQAIAKAIIDPKPQQQILIIGGGYAGFYTAWKLEKLLRKNEAVVTLVDPLPYMTYQPFLPEVAAGSIEARHAIVPLRRHLNKCRVITARVTGIDHQKTSISVLKNISGMEVRVIAGQQIRLFGTIGRAVGNILGWVWRHPRHQVDLQQFPHVLRWYQAMMARPAVQKGFAVSLRRD